MEKFSQFLPKLSTREFEQGKGQNLKITNDKGEMWKAPVETGRGSKGESAARKCKDVGHLVYTFGYSEKTVLTIKLGLLPEARIKGSRA